MQQVIHKIKTVTHTIRNGEERVPVTHTVEVEIHVDAIADIIAQRAARNSTGRATWVSGYVRAKVRRG